MRAQCLVCHKEVAVWRLAKPGISPFFELSLNACANFHVHVTYEAAPGLYDPAALIAGLAP
jgi:hypothetical protein